MLYAHHLSLKIGHLIVIYVNYVKYILQVWNEQVIVLDFTNVNEPVIALHL